MKTMPIQVPQKLATPEQIEAFGRDMEAIRTRVLADLGERDAEYIRRIVRLQRRLELTGRGLMYLSFLPPAWLAGVAALSVSKILDNMEIGHNVMHGQYDWMRDPALNSKTFDWDNACPSDQWRHSHNYLHHTYTNVIGKDRDIGYGVMRIDESQEWRPYYLANPLWAFLLMTFFQYGVALHEVEADNIFAGRRTLKDARGILSGIWKKTRKQTLKDYVLFPLLAGPMAPFVFAGNAVANLARNLWSSAIIFCGHFPDGVHTFTEEEIANETREHWYYRQLLGSANIEGGRWFHIMSGNLSFQVEHHLFPDLPAHRYVEIADEVRASCERNGLPYNTGPMHRQFGSVVRRIFRLALPTRRKDAGSGTPMPEMVAA